MIKKHKKRFQKIKRETAEREWLKINKWRIIAITKLDGPEPLRPLDEELQ